jgi:hypothetical protein
MASDQVHTGLLTFICVYVQTQLRPGILLGDPMLLLLSYRPEQQQYS